MKPLIDLRETGRLVPAAAGDHRGQPGGQHRHGHLLPGDRSQGRHLRDRRTTSRAIEQLTVTTLRNVIGGMTLEDTLTSRDKISAALRHVLDEATGKWGIRVNRVELKAVDPPGLDPGGDGEADARRARPARRDPHGGGRQAVADPDRRGREAVARSCGPRAGARRRSSRRRASRRRSRRSSTRSTAATPTRSCSPTSTCRCCRRSPRASRTRSGSSRARSPRRSPG